MKCPKCGCEFEGNFCPNCGTVVGEVTRCPVCGKERTNNERFCSGCGYAYEKPEQKKEINAPVTLYKALHLTPIILFAAMAVLAFLFSIAPAISGMGSVSAYGLLGDDSFDGMQGTAIFLLIAELLFLVAAAALAYFTYKFKSTGDKRFYTVLKANVAASAAYYLILFIIGIVMCAQVGAYDDGWGLFSVGACPVLFIVFSLLFGIAEAASVILCSQLIKKYPQLKEVKLVAESSAAVGVSVGGAAVQGAGQAAVKKERAPLSAQAKKKIIVRTTIIACIIIAIIVIIVVNIILSNIFRAGKVSKINLGDSKSQVQSILGEPYEDESTDSKWIYYSSEYTDILDELAELDEKYENATNFYELENLLEQETELYEKLSTISYKTITINFEETSDSKTTEYVVSSVWLDADCCEDYINENEKTLESVSILSGAFDQYSTATSVSITYEAKFTDGSYVKSSATAKRNSFETLTDVSSNIEVTWSDNWHKNYSGEVGVTENTVGYYISGNTLYITANNSSYNSNLSSTEKTSLTEVIISDDVTKISASAFSGYTSLTNITIGNSVSSIGDKAFYNCPSLKSFSINSNNTYYKTIDGNLYSYNGKTLIQYASGKTDTSFTIPDEVTTIGKYAFCNCSSITSIIIPTSVTTIKDNAFASCSQLTKFYYCGSSSEWQKISIGSDNPLLNNEIETLSYSSRTIYYYSETEPDYNTGYSFWHYENDVMTIWVEASDVSLTLADNTYYIVTGIASSNSSIVIPSTYSGHPVKEIASKAFYYQTSLTSITIPDSITSVGERAFYYCNSLKNVYYGGTASQWASITFEDSFSAPLCSGSGGNLYLNGTLVTEITLEGITTISNYAFYYCTSLTSVTISDSITSIGNYAFRNCTTLTSVTIGSSATSIGDYAFYGCTSLKSIIIPDSVISIGNCAFRNCTSLESVTFENTSGWYVTKTEGDTSGTDIASDDLENASTAATYLKSTYYYYKYYWYRSED